MKVKVEGNAIGFVKSALDIYKGLKIVSERQIYISKFISSHHLGIKLYMPKIRSPGDFTNA